MENTTKAIWEMIDAGDARGLAARMSKAKSDLDARLESARVRLAIAEKDSPPIVETALLPDGRYRIENVRHGRVPAKREFDSHVELMIVFRAAN